MTLEEAENNIDQMEEDEKQVTVQFVAESGQTVFQPFEVPRNISPQKLELVLKALFTDEADKNRPYLFFC